MKAKGVTALAGVGLAILALIWAATGQGSRQPQHSVPANQDPSPESSVAVVEPHNGAGNLEVAQDPGTRTDLQPEVEVHLYGVSDFPIEGRVLVLERTPSLEQRLSSGRWGSSYLYEGALWEESQTTAGVARLILPDSVRQRDLLLLALAPGYAPLAQTVFPSREKQELRLTPVEAIKLRVVDHEDKPVVGASCRLSPMYFDWGNGPESFEERLSLRAYIEDAITDSNGEVFFPICYPGAGNSIQVEPGYPLAIGSQSYCSPGDLVVIQCSQAFSVEGRFLDAVTLEPIPNAAVIYAKDTIEGTSTVKSGMTDQLGVFREEALPANVPALSVIAALEGYVFERHRIVSPEPGKRYEHEFHFQKAHELALQLNTSWGEPLTNSLVRLRQGRHGFETAFHPTDEQGVARIPAVLESEAAYEVLIHVDESFWALPDKVVTAGEDSLVVQGLGRVMQVDMKTELEDSFLPISYDWVSLSAENQGIVRWQADLPSPLLLKQIGMNLGV